MNDDNKPLSELETESLEKPETAVVNSEKPIVGEGPEPINKKHSDKSALPRRFDAKRLLTTFNLYSVVFLLLLTGVVGLLIVLQGKNKTTDSALNFSSQELSTEALQKLNNTDSTVGDAKQTLTIAANAIFNNKVLVRGDLDVAGAIKVGGALNLPGISVSGTSSFDTVNVAKALSITGNTNIQGQLIVQQSLSANGDATFNGSVSASKIIADSIQFNQNLVFQKHIDSGGPTPSISPSASIGSAGTASINGTDTTGTVTINTGSAPASGILATITFKTAFSQTPHIQLTPVGSEAAALNYYVTRTATGFSIGSTNAPATGTTYVFDFFAAE